MAPSSKKLHWQGYVVMKNPCRFQGVRKALGLPDTTHMEIARGSDEENRAYCTKEETRWYEPLFDFETSTFLTF